MSSLIENDEFNINTSESERKKVEESQKNELEEEIGKEWKKKRIG